MKKKWDFANILTHYLHTSDMSALQIFYAITPLNQVKNRRKRWIFIDISSVTFTNDSYSHCRKTIEQNKSERKKIEKNFRNAKSPKLTISKNNCGKYEENDKSNFVIVCRNRTKETIFVYYSFPHCSEKKGRFQNLFRSSATGYNAELS
jgi:hypothetical protein